MTSVHPDNDPADTWVQRAERLMDEGSRHNMNTTPGYNTEPGYNLHSEPPLGHRMPVIRTIADVLYAIQPAAVIAFTAPKGTGKDTTARRLWDVDPSPKILQLPAGPRDASGNGEVTMQTVLKCGPWHEAFKSGEYRIDSVARPLYEMVATLTGLTIDELQSPALKERVWTVPPVPESCQFAQARSDSVADHHVAPTPSLVGWSPRTLLEWMGSDVIRARLGRDHWTELLRTRLEKHKSGITILTDVRFPQEVALCDLCIELRRPGREYDERPDSEGGHESRRRLPAHLIDFTYHLTPDMDYGLFAEDLILKVERKRAIPAKRPGFPDGPHAGIERGDA